jgi:hypothetical protein
MIYIAGKPGKKIDHSASATALSGSRKTASAGPAIACWLWTLRSKRP